MVPFRGLWWPKEPIVFHTSCLLMIALYFVMLALKKLEVLKIYWKTTVIFHSNLLIFINLPSILVRGLAIRDANVLQRSLVRR